MKRVQVNIYTVKLYMAGDIQRAKSFLEREVYPPNQGLCVTLDPTTFIYTGGVEPGFVVGFINYPRFPSTGAALFDRATLIAESLMAHCCQLSCCLVGTDKTVWLSRRPEDDK